LPNQCKYNTATATNKDFSKKTGLSKENTPENKAHFQKSDTNNGTKANIKFSLLKIAKEKHYFHLESNITKIHYILTTTQSTTTQQLNSTEGQGCANRTAYTSNP
jgi:hypothetical protein